MNDVQTRQGMGCAYEAPLPGALPWTPPDGPAGYDLGEPTEAHPRGVRAPTVCPGWTTRLPQIVEVTLARAHWDKGQLALFCGDDGVNDELLNAILILEGASNAVEHWLRTPADKGGGG